METEAEGADAEAVPTETVPAEAEPTGTKVVLLDTGYGATGTALLRGTTGAVPAVLRMTAGVEELAATTGTTGAEVPASTGLGADEDARTTGADERAGVTIGATGAEETATGAALVATAECVKVHGQSVIVKVVASVTVWILPLMEREVADEQKVVRVLTTSVVQVVA